MENIQTQGQGSRDLYFTVTKVKPILKKKNQASLEMW